MAAYYARCVREDADDLQQEAWVGLLEAMTQLDVTIGSPDQYLVQRARWRLLDFVKYTRLRRMAPLEAAAPAGGAFDDLPDEASGDVLLNRLLADDALDDFARGLTATQRHIVTCLVRGYTWRETGLTLGCTSANVAYHVRQIRRAYLAWVTHHELDA